MSGILFFIFASCEALKPSFLEKYGRGDVLGGVLFCFVCFLFYFSANPKGDSSPSHNPIEFVSSTTLTAIEATIAMQLY